MPFPAFWAVCSFFTFVLTVLVFRAKIKKSATLYGGPPYWFGAYKYFLAYPKINRFNITSSIHNSNMEYQSFLQGGAGHH
jgi:hypothetical protein